MKLKSIRARGFKGLAARMGREEIFIDLSGLSGLVAITGENGMGKTTLLELMTPYRQFASRDGALASHVFLRDSFKELTFDHMGHDYRVLVKLDSESEKSEGFIWRNGETLVSGKAREYDRAINDIFGSPELFFSSVFCAQNSEKLSDMTAGQIKGLFAEFLQLEKYADYEAIAKQAVGILSGLKNATDNELQGLSGIDNDAALAAFNAAVTASIAESKQKSAIESRLDAVTRDLADLKEQQTRQQGDIERRNLLTAQLQTAKIDLDSHNSAASCEIDGLGCRLETLKAETNQPIIEPKTASRETNENIIAVNTGLVESLRNEIENRRTTASKAAAQIGEKKAEQQKIEGKIRLLKADREEAILRGKLEATKNRAALLAGRGENCMDSECSFIKDAIEAQREIPGIEHRIADRQQAVSAEINSWTETLEKTIQEAITIADNQDLISVGINQMLVEIRQYEGQSETAKNELKSIEDHERKVLDRAKSEEEITRLQTEIYNKVSAADDRTAELEKRITGLEIELAKIVINTDLAAQVAECEKAVADAKRSLADNNSAIASANAAVTAANIKLAESEKAIERRAELQAERDRIVKELSEWQYVQNACGKNGIQAIEISAAAPAITAIANDLLAETYGPLFSVRLDTIDPETGKETLRIMVINEEGKEINLAVLSGGEKVWILKSLRLSMTLLAKENSGKKFDTAFSDEEDGSLDPVNAQNFINMYRAFIKRGCFDTCFFISHRPECISLSDHKIILTERGIEVN